MKKIGLYMAALLLLALLCAGCGAGDASPAAETEAPYAAQAAATADPGLPAAEAPAAKDAAAMPQGEKADGKEAMPQTSAKDASFKDESMPKEEGAPAADKSAAEPAAEKEASAPAAAAEAPVITEEATAESEAPAAEPQSGVLAGEYTGADGSVLTIKEDLTVTYKTAVSGTVNGVAMSGTLTFHGTVDQNADFSFTKVTYMGLDLTKIAADSGYDDASPWQNAARELYLSQTAAAAEE